MKEKAVASWRQICKVPIMHAIGFRFFSLSSLLFPHSSFVALADA